MTRLAYCYRCENMAPLPDYKGNPDFDVVLQDWIERHLHGFSPTETGPGMAHPGGMIFPVDESKSDIDRRVISDRTGKQVRGDDGALAELSNDEMEAVQIARAELRKIGKEVNEYRDDLRIDATVCHQKHGQPHLPGKGCIDYQADSKRIGRKDVPRELRQFLCTYCPYESSVTVQKRANRGDYKESAGQRRRRR